MVDAVNLRLVEHPREVGVQRARGIEIVPERFLDDDVGGVGALEPATLIQRSMSPMTALWRMNFVPGAAC
jgi:hypothetical protein